MSAIIRRIDGNNYKKCQEFAEAMWAGEKSRSHYNKGIANTKADPTKVQRGGCLGEMAFSLFIGAPVDFEYKKGGKAIDFEINGCKIDVKTALKLPEWRATLVMCVNEKNKPVPLKSDIYVSAYIKTEVLGEYADVVLVGWHWQEEISEQSPLPARTKWGRHQNYELAFEKARPMSELKEFFVNG